MAPTIVDYQTCQKLVILTSLTIMRSVIDHCDTIEIAD